MNEIINLIWKRNKNGQILNKKDVELIIARLCSLYKITLDGIESTNDARYMMFYKIKSNKLFINYNKINDCSWVALRNYQVVFGIVHELRHYNQLDYSLKSNNVDAYIYLNCFDGLMKDNIFATAFYSKNHDYFPIEINADIVAYLFVLYIAKNLGDDIIYTIFSSSLENRLNMIYTHNYDDVLDCLYGKSKIKELQANISEYNQFINGILFDKQKVNSIKQMLLLTNFH